ncbi:MAG: DUF2784 family protein [Paludibacteraceae bacterium]|nr:DUF2784 family protein [Paludibacteraceae bacterium]
MRFLFYLVFVLHLILLIINVVSIFILPFKTPWYVSVPLVTWLVALATNPIRCLLTDLENKIRERLNMPKIKGFIKHYILRR